MPDTLLSLGLAVAFFLPGFIIADLAESRRATRAARSDLELVLRGLAYALVLQTAVVLTGWTGSIVDDLRGEDGWQQHLGALAAYALVVGVVVPTLIGLALSRWLSQAEEKGPLRTVHYALGARDHREAWDYVFSKQEGAFVLIAVTEGDETRHFAAHYGPNSWASQAPTHPQEIYVEEVWPADADGVVDRRDLERIPARGMWISAEKIDRLEVLRPSGQAGVDG